MTFDEAKVVAAKVRSEAEAEKLRYEHPEFSWETRVAWGEEWDQDTIICEVKQR